MVSNTVIVFYHLYINGPISIAMSTVMALNSFFEWAYNDV